MAGVAAVMRVVIGSPLKSPAVARPGTFWVIYKSRHARSET